MKQRLHLLLFLLIFGQQMLHAQVGQYPITANLIVNPPSTTYLSDYSQLGSQRLQVNLFQNDFNEPDIDVRLKIRIEGNGVTLETNPNWAAPIITTNPGQNIFSGGDLEGYLNPQNMIVNGIDPAELGENGGGLPEGLYQFCVEVFYYQRMEVDIAAPSCFTTTLLKNYPPILVFPTCGNVVPVNPGQQNVQFQWQSNADANIMVEYLLTIAEVPEGMNPNDVLNGAQTPILDEEPILNMNTFLYGPSEVDLEVGKTYAYRVQVQDLMGLTTFENDGFSEVCTFDYGFSANGPVPLNGPADAFLSDIDNQASFTWNRPQEVLPSQDLYYKLKMVEMSNGQQRENAIQFNAPFYEETTDVLPFGGNLILPPELYPLPSEKAYAWQIMAYSDASGTEVKVGESEVRIIYTAPAVPRFKVGSPFEIGIEVIGLTNVEDVGDDKIISGNGTAIVRENGETHQVVFENVKVTPYADSWQLKEGEIISPVQSEFIVDINNSGEDSDDPDYNGNMEFNVENFVFTTSDFHLEGRVNWFYPHATNEPNGAVVKSVFSRVLFNEYQILDNYILLEDHSFDLLEPNAFTINYTAGQETSGSRFEVTESSCKLHLYGSLSPNNEIKDVEDERIQFTFEDANNPYYWENENAADDKNVRIVPNATMQLDAQHTIFDLSDSESPSRASDEAWMGIYFLSWKMQFPVDFDGSNQLKLFEAQTYDFDDSQEDFMGFVDGGGLDLIVNKTFEEGSGPRAMFNTFPDDLMEIEIKMEDNSVDESFIDGFIYLPVISETEHFTYHVPFDNNGLQQAFLEDDLIDREVIFGPSDNPYKSASIKIKKAVFEDNERISFTINLSWEHFELEANNVKDLKLWGNGSFGFTKVNGTIGFPKALSGKDGDLELSVDYLKAGYSNEYDSYCIGFEASFIVGDEGSGISGLNYPDLDLTQEDDAPKTLLTAYRKGRGNKQEFPQRESNPWADNSNFASWGDLPTTDKPTFGMPIYIGHNKFKIQGWIWIHRGNKDWGDCFYGNLKATLNGAFKSDVTIDVKLLTGKKEDVRYFRADGGIAAGNKDFKITSKKFTVQPLNPDYPNDPHFVVGEEIKEEKWKGKKGITLGKKITLTSFSFRIYRHMKPKKGDMTKTVCGGGMASSVGKMGAETDEELAGSENVFSPIPIDYEIDASTNFGFQIAFTGVDAETGGKGFHVDAAAEANWGDGAQIGLKVYYYGGLTNTKDTKSAAFAGGGCATITTGTNFKLTVDIYCKNKSKGSAKTKPFCFQGALFLIVDNKVGLRKLAVGSRSFPLFFQAGCQGWGGLGWLKYEVTTNGEKTAELGLGIAFTKKAEGKWEKTNNTGKVRCGAKLISDFKFTFGGLAQVEVPSFRPRILEVAFGASYKLSGSVYGSLCPELSLSLDAYVGGHLKLNLVKSKGELKGSARVKVWKFKPRMKFSKSFNL